MWLLSGHILCEIIFIDPLCWSFLSLATFCFLHFVFTFGWVFDLVAVKAAACSLSLGRPHKISHAFIFPGAPQMTSDLTSRGPTWSLKKWVCWFLCGQHPSSFLSKHFSVVLNRSIKKCAQEPLSRLCCEAEICHQAVSLHRRVGKSQSNCLGDYRYGLRLKLKK